MSTEAAVRVLARSELGRVREIDRTERIDTILVQRGTAVEAVSGRFDAPAWRREGAGEHSLEHQLAAVEAYVDAGGTALGAFAGDRLVGIGVVVPDLRPGVAQLAYLHVTNGWRNRGVGARLCAELEDLAREGGATSMVVSATPSLNTVRFYERCGFTTAEPLPELYELEPDDVHLAKDL